MDRWILYGEELKMKNVFTKSFREASINMANAPEATQFIYLSKILGIENSIPQFKDLEAQMLRLREIDENEITKSVMTMHFIAGGGVALGLIATSAEKDKAEPVIGPVLFWIGILIYVYFSWKPLGKTGELKQLVNEFVDSMKNFKVTSDRIIVENMIPQDKSLS